MAVDQDQRLVLAAFGGEGIELRLDRNDTRPAAEQRRFVKCELVDEFGTAPRDMQGDKRARRMAKQVAASADRRNHRADVADFLVPGDRRGSGAAHRIVAALDAHDPEMGREHVAKLAIGRSEEHTSELQSLMRISYAVFCLKKKK